MDMPLVLVKNEKWTIAQELSGQEQLFPLRVCTEHSPVVAHVEGVEALGEALHVVGTHTLQEVDVILRVEPAHVMLGCLVRLENLRERKARLISHPNPRLFWL